MTAAGERRKCDCRSKGGMAVSGRKREGTRDRAQRFIARARQAAAVNEGCDSLCTDFLKSPIK